MQVSAIRSTPSTARGSRCRLTIDQPRRGADRAGLAELQLDGRAQPDHVAVVEHGLVDDRLAVDERGVMGLEQVALAVADQRGVVPRQVAHERDVGMAVGAGPAEDDAIVQADEIAADGIDPEQEPALGAGRLGPGQRPGGSRARGRRPARLPGGEPGVAPAGSRTIASPS